MRKISVFDWVVFALLIIGAVAYFAGARNVYREYAKGGISFQYPAHYTLSENSYSNKMGTFTEETISDLDAQGDGIHPVRIVVGVYDNTGNLSVDAWIKKHANDLSHFSSMQGDMIPVSIGGADGFAYPWVSMVNAEQVVLSHGTKIIYLTVIYTTPSDAVVMDFQHLLATFKVN